MPTIESLTQELNAEKAKVTTLEEALAAEQQKVASLEAENKEMGAKLLGKNASKKEKSDAPEIPTKAIEIDGKKYKFCVPAFRGAGGEVISAKVAALDLELCKSIVEIEGQGILKEVK